MLSIWRYTCKCSEHRCTLRNKFLRASHAKYITKVFKKLREDLGLKRYVLGNKLIPWIGNFQADLISTKMFDFCADLISEMTNNASFRVDGIS